MPFVKLDCGMLDSTIWFDRPARDIFVTALLMAEPREILEALPQYEVDEIKETGWAVPPGWYGFVAAAGPGIIRRALLDDKDGGVEALRRLGSPDPESRTPDFGGRRMVRVEGGFIILNYQKFRDRDYTAAERQQRYRDKQRKAKKPVTNNESNGVTTLRNTVTSRNVTQAEAEAEVEVEKKMERKARSAPFAPPTVEDVLVYAEELGYAGFDAEHFWNHHNKAGWKLRTGRLMESWKSAVVTWRKNEGTFGAAPAVKPSAIPPPVPSRHGIRPSKDGTTMSYNGTWFHAHPDGRRWLSDGECRPDGTPIIYEARNTTLNDEVYAEMNRLAGRGPVKVKPLAELSPEEWKALASSIPPSVRTPGDEEGPL